MTKHVRRRVFDHRTLSYKAVLVPVEGEEKAFDPAADEAPKEADSQSGDDADREAPKAQGKPEKKGAVAKVVDKVKSKGQKKSK